MKYVLLLILLIPLASAIGIGQPLGPSKTIDVSPGDSIIHTIEIQNTEKLAANLSISISGSYASFDGSNNKIILLTDDVLITPVDINVVIPINAPMGLSRVSISAVVIGDSGAVPLSVSLNDFFFVNVSSSISEEPASIQEPVSDLDDDYLLILVAVGLVVILSLLYIRFNK